MNLPSTFGSTWNLAGLLIQELPKKLTTLFETLGIWIVWFNGYWASWELTILFGTHLSYYGRWFRPYQLPKTVTDTLWNTWNLDRILTKSVPDKLPLLIWNSWNLDGFLTKRCLCYRTVFEYSWNLDNVSTETALWVTTVFETAWNLDIRFQPRALLRTYHHLWKTSGIWISNSTKRSLSYHHFYWNTCKFGHDFNKELPKKLPRSLKHLETWRSCKDDFKQHLWSYLEFRNRFNQELPELTCNI